MIGLIFLQHVENQVGRKGHLLARLALARVLALDQPADHRDLAERTLQKMRPLDPFDEFFGQYLGIEQILGVRHGPQRPDRDRIVGCDEAQGLQRSEEHTSELQSLMRISYAVFCLKKKNTKRKRENENTKIQSH